MENAITALEVVEKIMPAIPVAGSYLAAIMGTVVLGLKAVKSLDDEKDKVYQLAMRTYRLAIAIDTATKDKWETLDEVIKSRLEEVKRTIDQIGDFFQKYEKNKSRWSRFKKKGVDSKAVTKFINALDEELSHFNLITSTASCEALKQQALQLASQAVKLASMHEILSVPTGIDDNGLLIFSRATFSPCNADVEELFKKTGQSCTRYCYGRNGTSVEVITRFLRKGSKTYAIKKYTSDKQLQAQKMFDAALDLRLKLEFDSRLPTLVGTVGRNENHPCQVLQLNSGKLHIPLGYLLDNYDPYTSDSFLIFALLQVKATLTQWSILFDRWGCDFDCDGRHERERWRKVGEYDGKRDRDWDWDREQEQDEWEMKRKHCFRLVDETMVEINLSKGGRGFSLIYTGELQRCTSERRADMSRRIWGECGSRMPLEIRHLPLRLQDSDMYASKFENIEPNTRLPGIAPILLDSDGWWLGNMLSGYALSFGDVGYKIGDTFVLLSNVRDILGVPEWKVSNSYGKAWRQSEAGIYTCV